MMMPDLTVAPPEQLPTWVEVALRNGRKEVRCNLCGVGALVDDKVSWSAHCNSKRHKRNAAIEQFKQKSLDATTTFVQVIVERSGLGGGGIVQLNDMGVTRIDCDEVTATGCVLFHVRNVDYRKATLTLERCRVLSTQPFSQLLQMDISHGSRPVAYGASATVALNYHFTEVGSFQFPIVFDLTLADEQRVHAARTVEFNVVNRDVLLLAPVAPFVPTRWQRRRALPPADHYIYRSDRLPESRRSQLEQDLPIGKHAVPLSLRLLGARGFTEFDSMTDGQRCELRDLTALLQSTPTEMHAYAKKFRTMLYIEELQLEVSIRNYDMPLAKLQPSRSSNEHFFELRVPGVAEKRPSVLRGDHVYLHPLPSNGSNSEFEGVVHRVKLDKLVLSFSRAFEQRQFAANANFSVRFTFGRLPMMLQQRAVRLALELSLAPLLFPTKVEMDLEPIADVPAQLDWFDTKLAENAEQAEAVRQIVRGQYRPAPYIVFGPPGTGKTVTLVEAIKQVVRLSDVTRVIACAPSNTAADVLCQRLIKHVPLDRVFRLNAVSRPLEALPTELYHCSNVHDGDGGATGFYMPPRSTFSGFRVIVSTLVTAGRLVSARFPAGYFTHVFVDEAGQATEPEALIPLAGIVDPVACGTALSPGHVVLAGDPKQLSPVLHSVLADQSGLASSLLERLMSDAPIYQQQNDAKGYDATYLTKLVKNYRSHPDILRVPSELFYGGELQACAKKSMRESLCRLRCLPKQGFPLLFHGVIGKDMREQNSPSFFNPAEVTVVRQYIDALLADGAVRAVEIGVIAPYRKQVMKVKDLLRMNLRKYGEISVGSVEEFQGTERRVVIVSTVRSNADFLPLDRDFNLGFLVNAKRFNTAVTRAKALLILIGNPVILERDANWNRMLQYARENGAYVGVEYEPRADAAVDDLVRSIGSFNFTDAVASGKMRFEETSTLQPEE